MGKEIKAYQVNSLAKVDPSFYIEGDIFITKQSVGILANGEIKTIPFSRADLSNYVKKSDLEKTVKELIKKNE